MGLILSSSVTFHYTLWCQYSRKVCTRILLQTIIKILLTLLLAVQVLVEDKDEFEQDSDHQRIRRNLLSFFSDFDAETLPPPSTDKTVMNNIDNPLYRGDISPHFLQQVEYVRKRILQNCSAKRGFSPGSLITGFRKFPLHTTCVFQ